jgi:hypothetical protein
MLSLGPIALQNVKFAKAIDPRVNINKPRQYSVVQSAQQVLPQVSVATSGTNTDNVTFTVQPSDNSIIDRNMSVRYFVRLDFTGAGNPLLAIGTNDALRALPMSTSMTNCSVQINGMSFTQQPKDYVQALLRFTDYNRRRYIFSQAPAMPDPTQQYADVNPAVTAIGSNRNPLGLFGANVAEDPRGAFPTDPEQVSTNGNGVATQYYVITEPMFVSPLLWENDERPGLVGVNQLQINLSFSGLAQNVWSHYNGNVINSVTVTFYQNPQLLYTEMQPNNITVKYLESKVYQYPYYNLYLFPTNQLTLNAGTKATFSSNALSLPGVPEKLYIYAKRQDQDRTILTTDTFAGIENVSIKWGTDSGILAQTSQQDLWKISNKNGLHMTWLEFSKYVGSVVALSFGDDIQIPANQSPGLNAKYPLLVQASLRNLSSSPITYTLYLVAQYPGVAQIMNRQVTKSDTIFTPEALEEIQTNPEFPVVDYVSDNTLMMGGAMHMGKGLFGDLWSGIKDVGRTISNVLPVQDLLRSSKALSTGLSFIPGVGPVAANVASKLGYGKKRQTKPKTRRGAGLSGGMLSGGCEECDDNVISREELMQRL